MLATALRMDDGAISSRVYKPSVFAHLLAKYMNMNINICWFEATSNVSTTFHFVGMS